MSPKLQAPKQQFTVRIQREFEIQYKNKDGTLSNKIYNKIDQIFKTTHNKAGDIIDQKLEDYN